MSYTYLPPGETIPNQSYGYVGTDGNFPIPSTGGYGLSAQKLFGPPIGRGPNGDYIFDPQAIASFHDNFANMRAQVPSMWGGIGPYASGGSTSGQANPSAQDMWNSYDRNLFPANNGNPRNPFSYNSGYTENGPGTEAYNNAQEWNKRPLSNGEYAGRLKQVLFRKELDANARASAADSAHKIQLFDRMTPAQTSRVYSGAPQSADEKTIQDTISGYNSAGEKGFEMGYFSDLEKQKQARAAMLFDRQIRGLDQGYSINQLEQARKDKLLAEQLASQKDQLAQQRIDLAKQAQADHNQQVAQNNVDRAYRNAQIAVSNGAVQNEADVYGMFPDLSDQQKGVLAGIVRSRNQELGAFNQQRQAAVSAATNSAELANQGFQTAKEKADADFATQQTIQAAKDNPGFFSRLGGAVSDLFHHPIDSFAEGMRLPSEITGLPRTAENPYARSTGIFDGPPAPRMGRTPAEDQAIAQGLKQFRGQIQFDPRTGKFGPAPSLFIGNGYGGGTQQPAISYADLNSASASEGGGRGAMDLVPTSKPIDYSHMTAPNPFGHSDYVPQYQPTGDSTVDLINQSLTPQDRANYQRGEVHTGQGGRKLIYNGYWFEPL